MKATRLGRGLVIATVVGFHGLASHPTNANTYPDAVGDTFVATGILDITSVEVNNSATDLIFKINLNGNPIANNVGKYMIGIDSAPGGDISGDAWVRPIGMATGMDYMLGSWADYGNGVQLFKYTLAWNMINAFGLHAGAGATARYDAGFNITKDTSSVTLTIPLTALGFGVGNSFNFDVYTTIGRGSDGAADALANPNQTIASWSTYYNSGSLVEAYTIIPEPSALVLVGMSGLALIAAFRLSGRTAKFANHHR